MILSANLTSAAARTLTPLAQPAAPAANPPEGNADGLRAIGDGIAMGSEMLGVSADKAYIHPVEGLYGAGDAAKNLTLGTGVEKVGKIADKAFSGLGFMAAFHGMLVGGILRSPGSVAKDITSGAADRIDGKSTLQPKDFTSAFPGNSEPSAPNFSKW